LDQIRAFIAIELSHEIKQVLERAQSQLKSRSRASVKWVEPKSIHLTLKFLGNIETGMVSKVNATLENAVAGIKPFKLGPGGLGVFPNLGRVRVVWIGLEGETDRLIYLQNRIENELQILGFSAEARGFSPHLTLGRVRDDAAPVERQELGKLIGEIKPEIAGMMMVNSIKLIKSQLTPTGPIYTILSSIEFK
jgi:2'-5' RNA ligase